MHLAWLLTCQPLLVISLCICLHIKGFLFPYLLHIWSNLKIHAWLNPKTMTLMTAFLRKWSTKSKEDWMSGKKKESRTIFTFPSEPRVSQSVKFYHFSQISEVELKLCWLYSYIYLMCCFNTLQICGGAEWQMGGRRGQGPLSNWIWWHERADSIPVEVNVEHGPLSSANVASQALTHWNHYHIHLSTCTLGEVWDLECDLRSHLKSDGNVGRDGNRRRRLHFYCRELPQWTGPGRFVCQMWTFCNGCCSITINSSVICSLIKCHTIGLVPFLS